MSTLQSDVNFQHAITAPEKPRRTIRRQSAPYAGQIERHSRSDRYFRKRDVCRRSRQMPELNQVRAQRLRSASQHVVQPFLGCVARISFMPDDADVQESRFVGKLVYRQR
jgi:hypothetical protein